MKAFIFKKDIFFIFWRYVSVQLGHDYTECVQFDNIIDAVEAVNSYQRDDLEKYNKEIIKTEIIW